jgi:hypothetical protein
MAWTLNHVSLHITASSEEAAARGASLARGVRVFWRDRYEPHWDTITTTAQLVQRLEESRRMRLAYLDTWPDDPQLDVVYAPNERSVAYFGEMNAVGMTLSGPRHEADHFEQMAEIIRQAGEALGEA